MIANYLDYVLQCKTLMHFYGKNALCGCSAIRLLSGVVSVLFLFICAQFIFESSIRSTCVGKYHFKLSSEINVINATFRDAN